jgi:hypothetical protein
MGFVYIAAQVFMKKALIVSYPENTEYIAVSEKLTQMGVEIVLFNIMHFPDQQQIGFVTGIEDGKWKLNIVIEGIEYDSNEFGFVWIHRFPSINSENIGLSLGERLHRDSECLYFLGALSELFTNAYCYKEPFALMKACMKPLQMKIASEVGLTVAPTFIGNSKQSALEILNNQTEVAIKSAHAVGISPNSYQYYIPFLLESLTSLLAEHPDLPKDIFDNKLTSLIEDVQSSFEFNFTKKVSTVEIKNNLLDLIENCPITIQGYVEKAYEVRLTIVNKQFFACGMYSQENDETIEDFRATSYMNNLTHQAVDVPDELKEKMLQLMERLDIDFGSADFIYTPDGQYYFLEINPEGGWYWTEELAGLPISSAIAEWIAEKCLDVSNTVKIPTA